VRPEKAGLFTGPWRVDLPAFSPTLILLSLPCEVPKQPIYSGYGINIIYMLYIYAEYFRECYQAQPVRESNSRPNKDNLKATIKASEFWGLS
jgi:hypothetical protein